MGSQSRTQLKRLSTQHIADLQYHVSPRRPALESKVSRELDTTYRLNHSHIYVCVYLYLTFQSLFPYRFSHSVEFLVLLKQMLLLPPSCKNSIPKFCIFKIIYVYIFNTFEITFEYDWHT